MKISPNQDFKHDRETYEKGQEYDVPDELAYYFTQNGWVGEQGAPTQEQTLDVKDGRLGQSAEVK